MFVMNGTPSPSKKHLLIVASVVGALALGGVALAGPHKGRRGGPGGGPGLGFRLMRMVRHLDLTEEQEVKAVRLRHQMKEEMQAGKVDRPAQMKAVATELAKPTPDAAKLHGIADQMLARMSKMTHAAIDKFLELHATFTPEQREKLGKRLERRAERRGRRDRGAIGE
jgi:Spy/CpxP family protein refolding chaperone